VFCSGEQVRTGMKEVCSEHTLHILLPDLSIAAPAKADKLLLLPPFFWHYHQHPHKIM